MESVAIVLLIVVGIASLGMAVLGTYRNVNNPQADVIRVLLEERENLIQENKQLRDQILLLVRVMPVSINNNIIEHDAEVGQLIAGSGNTQSKT